MMEEISPAGSGTSQQDMPDPLDPALSLTENLVSMAVRLAHHTIVGKRHGHLAQMGTTVALLVVEEDEAIIAHIGDSRVYRLRDGELESLTRDHSFYNELIAAGTADMPGSRDFAYKNIITRALGIPTSSGELPELRRETVLPGDIFLLSSDGVHDVLSDEEITRGNVPVGHARPAWLPGQLPKTIANIEVVPQGSTSKLVAHHGVEVDGFLEVSGTDGLRDLPVFVRECGAEGKEDDEV
ncbi:MAG: PP2C family protein-serine/threonine phosphatase [Bradymonadaceae bacterium]